MNNGLLDGWITVKAAQAETGYTKTYLRRLAATGRIQAHKVTRDWLLNEASLRKYVNGMQQLGRQRYNPWREELADQGRGRHASAMDSPHPQQHTVKETSDEA
jgi:excisionase family DNA binding protein